MNKFNACNLQNEATAPGLTAERESHPFHPRSHSDCAACGYRRFGHLLCHGDAATLAIATAAHATQHQVELWQGCASSNTAGPVADVKLPAMPS